MVSISVYSTDGENALLDCWISDFGVLGAVSCGGNDHDVGRYGSPNCLL